MADSAAPVTAPLTTSSPTPTHGYLVLDEIEYLVDGEQRFAKPGTVVTNLPAAAIPGLLIAGHVRVPVPPNTEA
jgi:hypothetical protein